MIRAIQFIRRSIPRVRSAMDKVNAVWSKISSHKLMESLRTAYYIIEAITISYTRYGALKDDLKEIGRIFNKVSIGLQELNRRMDRTANKLLGFQLELDAKASDQYLAALEKARDPERPRDIN